jgi:hypothetical protein
MTFCQLQENGVLCIPVPSDSALSTSYMLFSTSIAQIGKSIKWSVLMVSKNGIVIVVDYNFASFVVLMTHALLLTL